MCSMTGWKYALILVQEETEIRDRTCKLVELYKYDDEGEVSYAYCDADLMSPEEIMNAYTDVAGDGINTWFYENGEFDYENGEWEWQGNKELKKATVSIDFDGVINSYKSGFIAIDKLPDPPVDGALEFIQSLINGGYRVAIFSTRNALAEGRLAIMKYMRQHGLPNNVVDELEFPSEKPIAKLYIDDRGFHFTGVFPTLEEIENFVPWHGGKSSSEDK